MRKLLSVAAIASLAASSASLAATVTVSTGTVSVNSGGGWQSVVLASPANPGDKVMAAKNSEGEIVYEDGCFERVKPGQVKTVKATSPCNGTGGSSGGGLAGLDAGLILGVAAVGGIIAVVASSDDDDDAPMSP